jgi:hypothetical protein
MLRAQDAQEQPFAGGNEAAVEKKAPQATLFQWTSSLSDRRRKGWHEGSRQKSRLLPATTKLMA